MTTHRTHNALRLGDNLATLHFLRRLALANPLHHFIHYAHLQYIAQLSEVVCDVENVQLLALESVAAPGQEFWKMQPKPEFLSIDTWKNAGGFWDAHPLKLDYAQFYLGHCWHLAERMGLQSPMRAAQDILFDYPALRCYDFNPCDFLVIYSRPMSGQLPGYNQQEIEGLIANLSEKYATVAIRSAPHLLTVTQIGALSRFCKYIIMVSTGASWPTFNVFNLENIKLRIVLIGDGEKINFGTNTTEHAANVAEVRAILGAHKLL